MAHPLMNSNTADRLLGAICDTLIHSLWQGILLAAIAGLIVICTRKATSALRYNLLVSSLLLFAIGVGITFTWKYDRAAQTGTAIVQVPHIYAPVADIQAQPVHIFIRSKQASSPGFASQLESYLSVHRNTIVFIWFLIVCARSLQLAFGLYGTYRIRRINVFAIKGHWQQRMQQLAVQLGIKQTITFLESGIAKVPMVFGHLKPVVLVPIGLLTALSAEEVEAILIHELAHIKRSDYLVNILQSLVEIILFFNPAVLWVSKLIKTERENCCDDLAVAQNNNKMNYIRALVSCEEYQTSVPAYAMGLAGGKNALLNRVKRMATNRNYSLNLFEKTVLAICLVVLGLGISAFTAREDIKKAVKSIVVGIHHDVKAAQKEKVKVGKSDTTKKTQAEQSNNVNQLLNKLAQLHSDTLKPNGISIRLQANLNPSISLSRRPDSSLLAQIMNNNASTQLLVMRKSDTNVLKNLRQTSAIGRELYREGLITDTNHLSITTHLDRHELIVNGVRMPEDVFQRMYTKFYKKDENGRYSNNYTDGNARSGRTYANTGTNYSANANSYGLNDGQKKYWDGQQWKLMDEIKRDGLIADGATVFSFSLSDKQFVINGAVQSDEVFKKYYREYAPANAGNNWDWSYYNRWDAHSDSLRNDRNRVEAERDKKLVADLLQDGLITDPQNVTVTLNDTKFIINGKKQSDGTYKKYRDKYMPGNTGTSWSWTYSRHE